jgi:hypothetical protein
MYQLRKCILLCIIILFLLENEALAPLESRGGTGYSTCTLGDLFQRCLGGGDIQNQKQAAPLSNADRAMEW